MNQRYLDELRDAALKAISSRENKISIHSSFREVFKFTFRRKKYVAKVDFMSRNKNQHPARGFCSEEARRWELYKDSLIGRFIAPVLIHGIFDNGRSWLVMSELQTITKVANGCGTTATRTQSGDYLFDKIYPKIKNSIGDKVDWEIDRMTIEGLGRDLHVFNWGMDNRGNWMVFDYAGSWT